MRVVPQHAARAFSVGIFGAAGAVGSAAAFALATGGAATRLVLVDTREALLTAHATDMAALAAVLPGCVVEPAGPAALAGCDVVVACAGAPHRDHAPRSAFLAENAAIVAQLADALAPSDGWGGRVVLVTNPVDALATWLRRRLGLPRERVLGYALNDELRLRAAIAGVLGCRAGAVDAWVAGEHGPHAVPLLSRIRVGGVPVALDPWQRAAVLVELDGWYERWQRLGTGRTAVWSTAWGVAALVRALRHDDERVRSVSVALEGEYGIHGVCLAAPVRVDGAGATVLEWPLEADEARAMGLAAEAVETAVESIEHARTAA